MSVVTNVRICMGIYEMNYTSIKFRTTILQLLQAEWNTNDFLDEIFLVFKVSMLRTKTHQFHTFGCRSEEVTSKLFVDRIHIVINRTNKDSGSQTGLQMHGLRPCLG